MSNGMYCSASQWMDSASSSVLIWGRLIFLTMTALPETPVADVGRLDLVRLEQPLDRVDDGARVHDGAVDDGLGGQRLDADVQELVLVAALAADLDLHRLDGRGADVDADQSLLPTEKTHGRLSLYCPSSLPSPTMSYRLRVSLPNRSSELNCDLHLSRLVKVLAEATKGISPCQAQSERSLGKPSPDLGAPGDSRHPSGATSAARLGTGSRNRPLSDPVEGPENNSSRLITRYGRAAPRERI